jgi:hypothetical protein
MDAYRKGLNGTQASWATKKYHGHRTIPPESLLQELEGAGKGALGAEESEPTAHKSTCDDWLL